MDLVCAPDAQCTLLSSKAGVELRGVTQHTLNMSTKEIVQDLLQRLPDNISLHEVAQKIEFVAAIKQGIDELDRGEFVPIEQVKTELHAFLHAARGNTEL